MKKQQIGIWLDFREANIITLQGEKVTIVNLDSNIDPGKPRGGSRPKTKWGPVDTVSEKQFLERRKREEKIYYENLINQVSNADELFIFGPAQAKEGLLKAIKAAKNFKPTFKGMETADSMTENQKVAKVRAFFTKVETERRE